jgi:homoaconitase/3-isopropylmalate dehydratase large subunit
MKQTLAQKLVARAAGRSSVTPGEIVTCKVDLAMMHDSSGPRRVKPMLERLGAKVWDPSKVVLITDHYLPAYDDESRKIIRIARDRGSTVQAVGCVDPIDHAGRGKRTRVPSLVSVPPPYALHRSLRRIGPWPVRQAVPWS